MIEQLKITTVVENTVYATTGLLAEHGLCFWIEADSHRLLFDTGQGRVLANNAEQLGIDWLHAEKLLLSHGHYDHTGGLHKVLGESSAIAIHAHPDAIQPRYSRNKDRSARSVGIKAADEQALEQAKQRIVWSKEPSEVSPSIHLTGEVPRHTSFEDVGGSFFLDTQCTKPDMLCDDQALYIDTPQGTVVVLGCAHAGVINTLDYISKLTAGRPIYAVLGGMHLVHASEERLEQTVRALKRYDIAHVAPAHCTGARATSYLWQHLGDRCVPCSVGSTFCVDEGSNAGEGSNVT